MIGRAVGTNIPFAEFDSAINYTNKVQEWIQAKSRLPTSQNLWSFQERSEAGFFRVRIVLLSGADSRLNIEMAWSDPCTSKKIAKQKSSWLTCSWLQNHHSQLVYRNGWVLVTEYQKIDLPSSRSTVQVQNEDSKPSIAPEECKGETINTAHIRSIEEATVFCNKKPHSYQIEAAQQAIASNAIVNMKTGTGTIN